MIGRVERAQERLDTQTSSWFWPLPKVCTLEHVQLIEVGKHRKENT
jgi:hypothetical protein